MDDTVNNIIPFSAHVMNGVSIQTVNARDLHAFLENRAQFTDWVKSRIEKFGFVENQDFTTFSESTEKGRPRTEYHISIDMAKELAMVENNEKGKQARRYFIECERIAKAASSDPMSVLDDPAAMRQILLTYTEKLIALRQDLDEAKPVVAAFERIGKARDGSLCVTDTAKALQVRPTDLFGTLQRRKWIYRRPGGKNWLGYQDKVQTGYLEHKVTEVTRGDGTTKITEQVLVTPKGLVALSRWYGERRDLGEA